MNTQIAIFKKKLNHFPDKEVERIIDAALWAKDLHKDQKRASGEPYFIHPLKVAEFLVDMKMDSDSVIAALLHPLQL